MLLPHQIFTYKVFRESPINRKDHKENFDMSEVVKEWSQKQRGEQRGSVLTAAASVYLMVTGHLRTRTHPSGRDVSTTRRSWAPTEMAAGKGAAAPWEKLTTLDPRAHAPRFPPFSVFGDVEREQEGANRKLEDANWITLSDFILQFYTNILRG